MQLYSTEEDFEKRMEFFVNLITAKTPPSNEFDQLIVNSIANQKHLCYVDFEANTKKPGALIGLGKEPDVPTDTSKENLRLLGIAHRNTGLRGIHMFIVTELKVFDSRILYFTGAKKSKNLYVYPHVETYQFEIERYKLNDIEKIGDMVRAPKTPPFHKEFVTGYFDIDYRQLTSLDYLHI